MGREGAPRGEDRTCYNCGKVGHLSKDCKAPKKAGGGRQGMLHLRRNGASGERLYEHEEEHEDGHV